MLLSALATVALALPEGSAVWECEVLGALGTLSADDVLWVPERVGAAKPTVALCCTGAALALGEWVGAWVVLRCIRGVAL